MFSYLAAIGAIFGAGMVASVISTRFLTSLDLAALRRPVTGVVQGASWIPLSLALFMEFAIIGLAWHITDSEVPVDMYDYLKVSTKSIALALVLALAWFVLFGAQFSGGLPSHVVPISLGVAAITIGVYAILDEL